MVCQTCAVVLSYLPKMVEIQPLPGRFPSPLDVRFARGIQCHAWASSGSRPADDAALTSAWRPDQIYIYGDARCLVVGLRAALSRCDLEPDLSLARGGCPPFGAKDDRWREDRVRPRRSQEADDG